MANRIEVEGNIGRDPQLFQDSGTCRFSVCDQHSKKKQDGTWEKIPLWFNCITFGETAQYVVNNFKKGSSVKITGKLRPNKFIDKQGKDRDELQFVVNSIEPWVKPKSEPKSSGDQTPKTTEASAVPW